MFKRSVKRFAVLGSLLGLLVPALVGSATAADYPKRAINLIVPFSAGGGCDLVARTFANTFEKYIGKSVVVSNRDGGGGTIGASYVVHSKPDGYNILVTVIGPALIQPLYGGTDYQTADLRPVGTIVNTPTMIVVNSKTGIKNFEDFMGRVASKDKPLTLSVAAAKGLPHLAVESFIRKSNANIKVMPYKGGNPAVAATLGGHVDAFCGHPSEVLSHCQNGDFIPIAVFAGERIPEFPDIATFKERGYDVTIAVWRGLAVPAKTPEDVFRTIESAMLKTFDDAEYKAAIQKIEPPVYLNSEQSAAMWKEQSVMLENLTKELGLYMQNKK